MQEAYPYRNPQAAIMDEYYELGNVVLLLEEQKHKEETGWVSHDFETADVDFDSRNQAETNAIEGVVSNKENARNSKDNTASKQIRMRVSSEASDACVVGF